jgi:hypothetical protein
MSSRHLFLASNGYVGLAPAYAQKGDEICFLFGGNVPYVVRKRKGSYKFVGECYCFGVMHGEAMEYISDGKLGEKTYILK